MNDLEKLIQFVDQHGTPIAMACTQDGGQLKWIQRQKRTRLNFRPKTIALRMERIVIDGNPADWMVNDILIGGMELSSQFAQAGDIPGEAFADCMIAFETVQTAMDVVFEVTYVGPHPEGQPFAMHVQCTAVY